MRVRGSDETLARPSETVRGRFAPSPTGALHFGSLLAAVASFLDARHRNGEWLVRIEDIDTARVVPGSAELILRTLERYGMEWDGTVTYQSRRLELYANTLDRLAAQGLIYPCTCSRRDLGSLAAIGASGPIYPGTCRHQPYPPTRPAALRLRTDGRTIRCTDLVQGKFEQDVAAAVGDFVLRRADGLFAYQLAVVVDDGAQGITDVVRGSDLLDSTPRQIYLQQQLGLSTPRYAHIPIALNALDQKLSKQTFARPLDSEHPAPLLLAALDFLGQQPPPDLVGAPLTDIWPWAIGHWQRERIPRLRAQRHLYELT